MSGKTGYIFLLHPRNTSQCQGQTTPRSARIEKIFQTNGLKKQTGAIIIISQIKDCKPKLIRKERKAYCILIKGNIDQEDNAILIIHATNSRAPKFIHQILIKLKSHINPHNLMMGEFYNPFSSIDMTSR